MGWFSLILWEAVNTLYALIIKISHHMSILENLKLLDSQKGL